MSCKCVFFAAYRICDCCAIQSFYSFTCICCPVFENIVRICSCSCTLDCYIFFLFNIIIICIFQCDHFGCRSNATTCFSYIIHFHLIFIRDVICPVVQAVVNVNNYVICHYTCQCALNTYFCICVSTICQACNVSIAAYIVVFAVCNIGCYHCSFQYIVCTFFQVVNSYIIFVDHKFMCSCNILTCAYSYFTVCYISPSAIAIACIGFHACRSIYSYRFLHIVSAIYFIQQCNYFNNISCCIICPCTVNNFKCYSCLIFIRDTIGAVGADFILAVNQFYSCCCIACQRIRFNRIKCILNALLIGYSFGCFVVCCIFCANYNYPRITNIYRKRILLICCRIIKCCAFFAFVMIFYCNIISYYRFFFAQFNNNIICLCCRCGRNCITSYRFNIIICCSIRIHIYRIANLRQRCKRITCSISLNTDNNRFICCKTVNCVTIQCICHAQSSSGSYTLRFGEILCTSRICCNITEFCITIQVNCMIACFQRFQRCFIQLNRISDCYSFIFSNRASCLPVNLICTLFNNDVTLVSSCTTRCAIQVYINTHRVSDHRSQSVYDICKNRCKVYAISCCIVVIRTRRNSL